MITETNTKVTFGDISSQTFTIGNDFGTTLPNLVIDLGNAKLVFNKPEVELDELIEVYSKLSKYLNTFEGVYI
jgi:hypothetical protein